MDWDRPWYATASTVSHTAAQDPAQAPGFDARWKLVGCLACWISISFWQHPGTAWLAVVLLAVAAIWLQYPWRQAWLLFQLAFWPTLPFLLVAWWIDWSWAGWDFALWAGKSLTSLLLGGLLLWTTPFLRILEALTALGVGSVLLPLIAFSYRFSGQMLTEFRWLRILLIVRGFRFRHGWHGYRTLAGLLVNVFQRSERRAERVGWAMQCRGYRGPLPTLYPFRTRPADVLRALGLVLLALSGWGWDVYGWPGTLETLRGVSSVAGGTP